MIGVHHAWQALFPRHSTLPEIGNYHTDMNDYTDQQEQIFLKRLSFFLKV